MAAAIPNIYDMRPTADGKKMEVFLKTAPADVLAVCADVHKAAAVVRAFELTRAVEHLRAI